MKIFNRRRAQAAEERRGTTHPMFDPSVVLYPTAALVTNGRPDGDIQVGPRSHIRGELLLFHRGGKISVGADCYVGEQTRVWSRDRISIGDRVLISHLCTIMDNLTHPVAPAERHAQFRAIVGGDAMPDFDLGQSAIEIADDVLIGCNCVVLRGVRIGRGSVIGAGSVVTKSIPAYVVAAGNPARVIRELTETERSG
jgi:acetyltransferase-like isoleucine patch superfamily enzyme